MSYGMEPSQIRAPRDQLILILVILTTKNNSSKSSSTMTPAEMVLAGVVLNDAKT